MSWDKESTLELIRLYKEHQAYLNDHHYKKKSVRQSFLLLVNHTYDSRVSCREKATRLVIALVSVYWPSSSNQFRAP